MPAFVSVLYLPDELHTVLASFVFLDLDHNHLLGRHAIFQLHVGRGVEISPIHRSENRLRGRVLAALRIPLANSLIPERQRRGMFIECIAQQHPSSVGAISETGRSYGAWARRPPIPINITLLRS